jgi:hypothetical protein
MQDSIDRITVAEAGTTAKCSTRTVRRAIAAGNLFSDLAWGRILIDRVELERWIAARQSSAPSAARTGAAVIAELLREVGQQ